VDRDKVPNDFGDGQGGKAHDGARVGKTLFNKTSPSFILHPQFLVQPGSFAAMSTLRAAIQLRVRNIDSIIEPQAATSTLSIW
jgi:hypothetical protein